MSEKLQELLNALEDVLGRLNFEMNERVCEIEALQSLAAEKRDDIPQHLKSMIESDIPVGDLPRPVNRKPRSDRGTVRGPRHSQHSMYPHRWLEVGQSFYIAGREAAAAVMSSTGNYQNEDGKRFKCRSDYDAYGNRIGARVWRIA